MSDNTNVRYRILSIDGGPAAPVQIRMLRKLEQAYPGVLASTHQFGGTSDGALIALFLASRLPADFEAAKRVSLDVLDDAIAFSNATIRALQPTAYSMLRFMSGLGPLVDSTPLRRILEDAFGDMKIAEIERDCQIVSFNVDQMAGELYLKLGSFCPIDRTIVDALLATSALPMYMPLHRIDGSRYVDGAICANDAAFDAVAGTAVICMMQASSMQGSTSPQPAISPTLEAMRTLALAPTLEQRCSGFRVLSLGLEETNSGVYVSDTLTKRFFGNRFRTLEDSVNWGWLQWIINRSRLLPAMIYAANSDNMSFLCEQLFPKRYFRYAPEDEVIGEVWRVATHRADLLLHHADELVESLWQQGTTRQSPTESIPLTAQLMDFVQAEWLEKPTLADKPAADQADKACSV